MKVEELVENGTLSEYMDRDELLLCAFQGATFSPGWPFALHLASHLGDCLAAKYLYLRIPAEVREVSGEKLSWSNPKSLEH